MSFEKTKQNYKISYMDVNKSYQHFMNRVGLGAYRLTGLWLMALYVIFMHDAKKSKGHTFVLVSLLLQ